MFVVKMREGIDPDGLRSLRSGVFVRVLRVPVLAGYWFGASVEKSLSGMN